MNCGGGERYWLTSAVCVGTIDLGFPEDDEVEASKGVQDVSISEIWDL